MVKVIVVPALVVVALLETNVASALVLAELLVIPVTVEVIKAELLVAEEIFAFPSGELEVAVVRVPQVQAHLSEFSIPVALSHQPVPSGSVIASSNSCVITESIPSAPGLLLGEDVVCAIHPLLVPAFPTKEYFIFWDSGTGFGFPIFVESCQPQ